MKDMAIGEHCIHVNGISIITCGIWCFLPVICVVAFGVFIYEIRALNDCGTSSGLLCGFRGLRGTGHGGQIWAELELPQLSRNNSIVTIIRGIFSDAAHTGPN